MSIKINNLELENVKRVKAVKFEPSANGLTIIGGNNKQGKTSVLDSIAWALGGNRFKPSDAQREGSVLPPSLKIELSNGLIVERKGKNSDLKVTDPSGDKAGQNLLDSFISVLALDLPRFLESSNKEKADILLQIIGVGDELKKLEDEENKLYNQRHALGQIADQKKKFAQEMDSFPDVGEVEVSASDLIKQQQAILLKNAENQKHRENLAKIQENAEITAAQIEFTEQKIEELKKELEGLKAKEKELNEQAAQGQKTVEQLKDESTAEIEKNLEDIEELNAKIRANIQKENAFKEAEELKAEYDGMTIKLQDVRQAKMELLNGADLPLEGLSVADGELTFEGFKWDGMSGADKLKVATAIVRKLKPECGFVLMDKLEQMDLDTLKEFGEWLEGEGLQVIATRVSKGEECQIIIEDGSVLEDAKKDVKDVKEIKETKTWTKGVF